MRRNICFGDNTLARAGGNNKDAQNEGCGKAVSNGERGRAAASCLRGSFFPEIMNRLR